ncbi:hypothetical protein ACT2CI_00765 [Candidatus Vidania fulgoroideorum]
MKKKQLKLEKKSNTLIIHKSNKHIYLQLIKFKRVILSSSTLKFKKKKDFLKLLVDDLLKKIKDKKIKKIKINFNNYPFIGNPKKIYEKIKKTNLL